MGNLEDDILKEELACNWENCGDKGKYLRCYRNDLFVICPKYLKHKINLKQVKKMKYERKLKEKKL